MSNILTQAAGSRRGFLKVTGLAGLATLAATGTAQADEQMETTANPALAAEIAKLPRVKQVLVDPPFVPEHQQKAEGGPRVVEITLPIIEKKMQIDDDGTEIWALTFNGSVPGPMMVVHEGDYVEIKLQNLATNLMEHNIDFHAATGALGGGALTKVQPGEEVVLRWKATKPGVFVYHCAPGDIMIPYHVTHGMNGAIMVLPRDGLKDAAGKPYAYDRAYFIGEQDFYIPRDKDGSFVKYENAGDDMADALEVMRTLTPTHEVFNGKVGALTGEGAMKAKVGETVLFIHAQATRDTRPHLIGGHGDLVWEAGSFNDKPDTNLETWLIRGGSAGAMAYTFRQPGIYAYVNHNLIEAVMLGATAHVVVEGEWDDDLMTQVQKPAPIQAT
ncbi:nitrite reductase, copper-containing [Aestuariivirga litoralis]|uniref:Copper-containing nitrite reductase n=1 Tax=Aestuariivirga litoralis TaxID=2650924 RepID=A0A2W2BHQ7_9HYPH|nr:copper-containing nitrite reductase [Aestuariivirga litoralis]PZF75447.1 nitrite reductase, copper-containing [Aestuariivirga litoralis]